MAQRSPGERSAAQLVSDYYDVDTLKCVLRMSLIMRDRSERIHCALPCHIVPHVRRGDLEQTTWRQLSSGEWPRENVMENGFERMSFFFVILRSGRDGVLSGPIPAPSDARLTRYPWQ